MLYYPQSSRAVGLHLKEEWATTVPSIIYTWGGLNSHSVGVVLIWAVINRRCNPDSSLLYVQPSVSLISNFFNRLFWISEKECIFTVKCCDLVFFLYIRHEFDSCYSYLYYNKEICNSNFPPFCKKTKNYTTTFCFFYDGFFSMLWHF